MKAILVREHGGPEVLKLEDLSLIPNPRGSGHGAASGRWA
jgi:hypothetical protein